MLSSFQLTHKIPSKLFTFSPQKGLTDKFSLHPESQVNILAARNFLNCVFGFRVPLITKTTNVHYSLLLEM